MGCESRLRQSWHPAKQRSSRLTLRKSVVKSPGMNTSTKSWRLRPVFAPKIEPNSSAMNTSENSSVTLFRMNTYRQPRPATTFRMNTYTKTGGGGGYAFDVRSHNPDSLCGRERSARPQTESLAQRGIFSSIFVFTGGEPSVFCLSQRFRFARTLCWPQPDGGAPHGHSERSEESLCAYSFQDASFGNLARACRARGQGNKVPARFASPRAQWKGDNHGGK
jgi:hypothetical protein